MPCKENTTIKLIKGRKKMISTDGLFCFYTEGNTWNEIRNGIHGQTLVGFGAKYLALMFF